MASPGFDPEEFSASLASSARPLSPSAGPGTKRLHHLLQVLDHEITSSTPSPIRVSAQRDDDDDDQDGGTAKGPQQGRNKEQERRRRAEEKRRRDKQKGKGKGKGGGGGLKFPEIAQPGSAAYWVQHSHVVNATKGRFRFLNGVDLQRARYLLDGKLSERERVRKEMEAEAERLQKRRAREMTPVKFGKRPARKKKPKKKKAAAGGGAGGAGDAGRRGSQARRRSSVKGSDADRAAAAMGGAGGADADGEEEPPSPRTLERRARLERLQRRRAAKSWLPWVLGHMYANERWVAAFKAWRELQSAATCVQMLWKRHQLENTMFKKKEAKDVIGNYCWRFKLHNSCRRREESRDLIQSFANECHKIYCGVSGRFNKTMKAYIYKIIMLQRWVRQFQIVSGARLEMLAILWDKEDRIYAARRKIINERMAKRAKIADKTMNDLSIRLQGAQQRFKTMFHVALSDKELGPRIKKFKTTVELKRQVPHSIRDKMLRKYLNRQRILFSTTARDRFFRDVMLLSGQTMNAITIDDMKELMSSGQHIGQVLLKRAGLAGKKAKWPMFPLLTGDASVIGFRGAVVDMPALYKKGVAMAKSYEALTGAFAMGGETSLLVYEEEDEN